MTESQRERDREACRQIQRERDLEACRQGDLKYRPNAKLTEQDVHMIVYMYRTGEFTQKEIARAYLVSQYTICSIINRKTWKHIWRK